MMRCVVGCCSVSVDDLYERKKQFVGSRSVAVASDDSTGKTMCCSALQHCGVLQCVVGCCVVLYGAAVFL